LAHADAKEHANNPINTVDKLNDGTEKPWISAGSKTCWVSLTFDEF